LENGNWKLERRAGHAEGTSFYFPVSSFEFLVSPRAMRGGPM